MFLDWLLKTEAAAIEYEELRQIRQASMKMETSHNGRILHKEVCTSAM